MSQLSSHSLEYRWRESESIHSVKIASRFKCVIYGIQKSKHVTKTQTKNITTSERENEHKKKSEAHLIRRLKTARQKSVQRSFDTFLLPSIMNRFLFRTRITLLHFSINHALHYVVWLVCVCLFGSWNWTLHIYMQYEIWIKETWHLSRVFGLTKKATTSDSQKLGQFLHEVSGFYNENKIDAIFQFKFKCNSFKYQCNSV